MRKDTKDEKQKDKKEETTSDSEEETSEDDYEVQSFPVTTERPITSIKVSSISVKNFIDEEGLEAINGLKMFDHNDMLVYDIDLAPDVGTW